MQGSMRTKHIDIHHHFMRDMVEDKDMDIKYIRSEENPSNIMTNNCSEDDYVKHMKSIMEGKLWELVETGGDNVKNNRVLYGVIDRN